MVVLVVEFVDGSTGDGTIEVSFNILAVVDIEDDDGDDREHVAGSHEVMELAVIESGLEVDSGKCLMMSAVVFMG